jgi:murein DD-endopeptidase MepM/ murein hydrolase activator NlpD
MLPWALSFRYCPPVRCHGLVTKWTESATPKRRLNRDPPPGVPPKLVPTSAVFGLDSPNTEGQALARHRSPGAVLQRSAVLDEDDALTSTFTFDDDFDEDGDYVFSKPVSYSKPTSRRMASPSSAVRGRVVVAAVALGAFAAAAAGQTLQGPKPNQQAKDLAPLDADPAALMGGVGGPAPTLAPDVVTVARTTDATLEAQKMAANGKISQAWAAQQAAKAEEAANKGKYVKPTQGTLTSSFGARWGTTHYGLDIANKIGTPIVAVTEGTVVEAGPASGFGLWVRIQHPDGSISVYGHVNTFSVREGQKVKPGEQIATIGNRGYSTGPHLHFEIWDASGKKLNPATWLAARGIRF